MLRTLAERDIRQSAGTGDPTDLLQRALQLLYQRKAFREETGMDEAHYPAGKPPPPPPPAHGPGRARGPKHHRPPHRRDHDEGA